MICTRVIFSTPCHKVPYIMIWLIKQTKLITRLPHRTKHFSEVLLSILTHNVCTYEPLFPLINVAHAGGLVLRILLQRELPYLPIYNTY